MADQKKRERKEPKKEIGDFGEREPTCLPPSDEGGVAVRRRRERKIFGKAKEAKKEAGKNGRGARENRLLFCIGSLLFVDERGICRVPACDVAEIGDGIGANNGMFVCVACQRRRNVVRSGQNRQGGI